ncbi:hypothetical protein APHAL10511_007903 [Amanita phalloides]|nr:hypothetical protein APHAL10511_007903 [Amanita phalloides]
MPFYAVIVDAGSSGTRPYIYHIWEAARHWGNVYQHAKVTEVFHKSGTEMGKIKGGIHLLVNESGEVDDFRVKEQLKPLFDDVKAALPGGIQGNTVKLFILATAGVRLLEAEHQVALHRSLEGYARTFGFAEVVSETITGTDEAKFGWAAAHYSQGERTPYGKGYVEMGGVSAQVVIPLVNQRLLDEANEVVENFPVGDPLNTVEVVELGNQTLFLGSYHLGSNAGYEAYKQALFNSDDERVRPGLGEIFLDPTKHPDYDQSDGTRTVRGIEGRIGGLRATLATWLTLDAANSLCPHPRLMPKVGIQPKLEFIGAATLWWSMGEKITGGHDFKYGKWLRALAASDGGDNNDDPNGASVFAAQWIYRVLGITFGIQNYDKQLTFTPYNGPNGKRLSWTLGKAVLLATPNLQHICNGTVPCFSEWTE